MSTTTSKPKQRTYSLGPILAHLRAAAKMNLSQQEHEVLLTVLAACNREQRPVMMDEAMVGSSLHIAHFRVVVQHCRQKGFISTTYQAKGGRAYSVLKPTQKAMALLKLAAEI